MNRENEIVHVMGYGLMERCQAKDALNNRANTVNFPKDERVIKAFKDAIDGPAFDGKDNR